jgi:hypothetical protein
VQQTSGYTGASALMTAARVRPAQGLSLVLERLCSSHLVIHEDDNGGVLRVRHQPRLHDVLATLQAPEGARAVLDFERGH